MSSLVYDLAAFRQAQAMQQYQEALGGLAGPLGNYLGRLTGMAYTTSNIHTYAAAPAKTDDSSLAWLDRRVNEVRVKL